MTSVSNPKGMKEAFFTQKAYVCTPYSPPMTNWALHLKVKCLKRLKQKGYVFLKLAIMLKQICYSNMCYQIFSKMLKHSLNKILHLYVHSVAVSLFIAVSPAPRPVPVPVQIHPPPIANQLLNSKITPLFNRTWQFTIIDCDLQNLVWFQIMILFLFLFIYTVYY